MPISPRDRIPSFIAGSRSIAVGRHQSAADSQSVSPPTEFAIRPGRPAVLQIAARALASHSVNYRRPRAGDDVVASLFLSLSLFFSHQFSPR